MELPDPISRENGHNINAFRECVLVVKKKYFTSFFGFSSSLSEEASSALLSSKFRKLKTG